MVRLRMTRVVLTVLFLAMTVVGLVARAQQPGESLEILDPLRGTWEGHFKNVGREDLTPSMSCEPVLDGNAIRVRNVTGGMVREAHYYWNPEKDQLEYIVLTNNGHIGKGSVTMEADLIVERGRQITPTGETHMTKNTWKVNPDGGLIVRGYTMKDGSWNPGHIIVFEKIPRNETGE